MRAVAVCPVGWLGLELDTATADASRLDDHDLIESIIAFDRLSSWAAARQARLLAEFAGRRPDDDPQAVRSDRPSAGSRYAADEIGLALRLSRGAAIARLGLAEQLAAVLPETLAQWEVGELDGGKVRAISDATWYLSAEHAVAVQQRVLPRAAGQTFAQLRAALARAVLAVDPEGAAARHRVARRDRRVVIGQEQEGMASLWALLPAPDALSAYEWLTRLARGLDAEDTRGMDARRADLLVELLTGQLTSTAAELADTEPADGAANPSEPGATTPAPPPRRPVTPNKPLVQVIMQWTTLTGADNQPCELAGYGPIPAPLAREIAADAVWKRLVTDPLSGALLDYGRATYHPPAALADFVRNRDVYCRQPTCRRRLTEETWMADPLHEPGLDPNSHDDASMPSDRGSTTSTPHWVRVLGVVIAIALIALIVVLHLTGTLGPGAH